MRLTDIMQTAWGNLLRNKTRSALTIIAVLVGAMAITLTNGIGAGIKSYLHNQVSNLGTDDILITNMKTADSDSSKDGLIKYDPDKTKASSTATPQRTSSSSSSPFMLTTSDIEKIKSVDGVLAVTPATSLTLDYITAEDADKYLLEASTFGNDFMTFNLTNGQQLNPDSDKNEILLPSSHVSALGFASSQDAIGKTVQLQVSNQSQQTKVFDATISGILNKSIVTSNSAVIGAHLASQAIDFQNQGKTEAQKNLYPMAFTKFDQNLDKPEIDALIARLSDVGYQATTIKDKQQMVFSIIDAIIIVLNMFGVVALLAASFGIVNTLYIAVQERTKETGLMKAVGMSKAKIFSLFSVEAIFLGLVGSVSGVVVAIVIGEIVNNVASKGFLKDFEGLELLFFELPAIAVIVTVITIIAFLAGTLPARKASRLDAIEALRYE